MSFLYPLKLFVFPFVFLVALPLALCAGVTTILAFLVLFLRLFLVYFDVGLDTLRYVLVGHAVHGRYFTSRATPSTTPLSSLNSTPLASPEPTTFRHRRRRRRQGSAGSGSITPIGGFDGLSLTPSVGLDRDFEGVGGWRLDSVDLNADAADEQAWYNLNSRLQIPDQRHHFRSQSGGAVMTGTSGLGLYTKMGRTVGPYNAEGLKMTSSPDRSRSRTPTISKSQNLARFEHHEYFPLYDGENSKKLGG
ncbi:hypothetical protein F5Y19DRAFT_4427 [Xylariaceae sp. FL1651]|nr:hypothetical protein F5Y19DRAFT_4427 [Xylariaceae sp. FL1651]